MLRRFGWTAYDHLGQVVILNLLWAVMVLPWLAAAVLAGAWGAARGPLLAASCGVLGLQAVAVSPPTALLFVAAGHWYRDTGAPLRVLLGEWRQVALRAQLLGGVFVAAGGLLVANMAFYAGVGGRIGLVLAYAFGWLVLFSFLLIPYAMALLAWREGTIRLTLQGAFGLALSQPATTVALGLAGGVMAVVAVLTGVGLMVGLASLWALLSTTVAVHGWARRSGQELPPVPRRSWREVVRPWEYR